jgi:hypothetical protein
MSALYLSSYKATNKGIKEKVNKCEKQQTNSVNCIFYDEQDGVVLESL